MFFNFVFKIGVSQMLKRVFVQILSVSIFVFFAGSVLFLASCEKSEPSNTTQNSTVQAAKPATPSVPGTSTNKPAPATTPIAAAPAAAPAQATANPQPATQTNPQPVTPLAAKPDVDAATPAVNPDWVAIDINLPKAVFVGTPIPTTVENLEPPLGHARPPFLAPKGVTNVALNKPVTGTDSWPMVGKLAFVTNGDKAGTDGHYVELSPGKQSVTIDLGKENEIWAIVVWHYHMQARVYTDVIVQVADDPNFTQNVKTIFNNDIDNSSEMGKGTDKSYTETNEGKLIDAKGVKARYVRLYSNGNNNDPMNHYVEVAVYGKAVE
jgi:hypothetical protein